MRKRKGDQYDPHHSSLGRECLSEQWTTQGPITRKRRGNQYSPDHEGVSFFGSPERADERRRAHDIGPTRDSLNRGSVSKKSPKIVKQEDGPSGSYQDSSDQDLEYVLKNWAKGPGARRRDKMRDSIEHLCKVICKLSTQVYKQHSPDSNSPDREYVRVRRGETSQRERIRGDDISIPNRESRDRRYPRIYRINQSPGQHGQSDDLDSSEEDDRPQRTTKRGAKQSQGTYRRKYDQCS